MNDNKETLLKYLEKTDYAVFFDSFDMLANSEILTLSPQHKTLLNKLREEFIFGNIQFDYNSRLTVFTNYAFSGNSLKNKFTNIEHIDINLVKSFKPIIEELAVHNDAISMNWKDLIDDIVLKYCEKELDEKYTNQLIEIADKKNLALKKLRLLKHNAVKSDTERYLVYGLFSFIALDYFRTKSFLDKAVQKSNFWETYEIMQYLKDTHKFEKLINNNPNVIPPELLHQAISEFMELDNEKYRLISVNNNINDYGQLSKFSNSAINNYFGQTTIKESLSIYSNLAQKGSQSSVTDFFLPFILFLLICKKKIEDLFGFDKTKKQDNIRIRKR